jgi:polygalacturonase
MQYLRSLSTRLPRWFSAGCLLALAGCHTSNDIAAISYVCETASPPSNADDVEGLDRCGAADSCDAPGADPNKCLPPEPYVVNGKVQWPADPPAECILKATRVTPPDGQVLDEPVNYVEAQTALDTQRINAALSSATCPIVKLITDGDSNAFLSAQIVINGKTLWIDKGVTLFMSRSAALFQSTGNCGVLGVNDSSACIEFLSVSGTGPQIIGEGTIDGQGGEPLVGHDYSWWQMSYALRAIDGSIGNPTLINLKKGTTGFVLYRVTLHNSAKFHVKLTSSPPAGVGTGVCDTMRDRGKGFIVWGITLLTPSKWSNSANFQLTPSWARNTDGVDPGTTDIAYCGVIACNTISTGDDHIAIKGGH